MKNILRKDIDILTNP